jgi:methionyl-tRNA formyltransferase
MKILDGKVELKETQFSIKPGEIHASQKEGLAVVCGDGNIFIINHLQPENRKAMSAYSYSLGANIQPGESFE